MSAGPFYTSDVGWLQAVVYVLHMVVVRCVLWIDLCYYGWLLCVGQVLQCSKEMKARCKTNANKGDNQTPPHSPHLLNAPHDTRYWLSLFNIYIYIYIMSQSFSCWSTNIDAVEIIGLWIKLFYRQELLHFKNVMCFYLIR